MSLPPGLELTFDFRRSLGLSFRLQRCLSCGSMLNVAVELFQLYKWSHDACADSPC